VAETEFSTTTKLPIAVIWDFVSEMDHWAPFVTGYQGHEKQSDRDSVWTLKGDVGVLARTVRFRVRVTEWAGPERVRFTLEGLNEALEGEGAFALERYEEETALEVAPTPARTGLWQRLWQGLFRWLFRLGRGRTRRGAHADAGPGAGMARLSFRLRVDPGGPQAPMVNAMLRPAMVAAAEDLANRIVGHLEQTRGDSGE
jgi:carbon monoxide dehydrogenase subunit G